MTQWQTTPSPSATLWPSRCRPRWALWRRSPAEALLRPVKSPAHSYRSGPPAAALLRHFFLESNRGVRDGAGVGVGQAALRHTAPTQPLMGIKELSLGHIRPLYHPTLYWTGTAELHWPPKHAHNCSKTVWADYPQCHMFMKWTPS